MAKPTVRKTTVRQSMRVLPSNRRDGKPSGTTRSVKRVPVGELRNRRLRNDDSP
jgi:hypothetical protein